MKERVRFKLNGEPVDLEVETDRRLLWILRSDLGLTGTKYGCGRGLCGACTVSVDQKAVRSCVTPVRSVASREVVTVEGLGQDGTLHPVQEAFIEHSALQCGICTPGMIMNAYSMLLANPNPSREEIVRGMEGNLCRCGAYLRIVRAIETAAARMKGA